MKKGFTLLELLIVIGILAILAAVTVLVINPAQLLKRARDSQRLSDLSTIQSAIGLYMTDVATPKLCDESDSCFFDCDKYAFSFYSASAGFTGDYSGTTSMKIDCTGWIPINFGNVSGGSPLGSLPKDPTNSSTTGANYYYVYKGHQSPLAYEINANLESEIYREGGTSDKESTDGGNTNALYEIGNTTTLLGPATSSAFFNSTI